MCECIGVNVLLYHFVINANVCTKCTYTVNKVNLNLLCGQEDLSEPSTGARMAPANGQTTKTKKFFYIVLVAKSFHLITNIYIHVQFFFSKRGVCFYWDIYGMPCTDWLLRAHSMFFSGSHICSLLVSSY